MSRILFIDDDKLTLRSFYEDLIDNYHLDVHWLLSADDVLETLKVSKFDAIILDLMMPVPENWSREDKKQAMDGLCTGEVLMKKIRKEYTDLPILIYTAKGGCETDEFSCYLRKPELTKVIVEID